VTTRGKRIYFAAGAATRLALILSILFGCSEKSGAQGTETVTPKGGGLRVLFLGNSLTYSNDIPNIVKALAQAAGKEMYIKSICFPGYNLEDQYRQGDALRALKEERWDFVVMQQGPTSLPEDAEDMTNWAKVFSPIINKAGARPAMYMVWPSIDRISYFDAIHDHYSQTAYAIKSMFIPAGEAWREAWRRDPKAPLYSFDQFHPSEAGSYLSALSIYGMLYGVAPQKLPGNLTLSSGQTINVPPALAQLLQDSATEANRQHGRK
jgi:hypothetical protein